MACISRGCPVSINRRGVRREPARGLDSGFARPLTVRANNARLVPQLRAVHRLVAKPDVRSRRTRTVFAPRGSAADANTDSDAASQTLHVRKALSLGIVLLVVHLHLLGFTVLGPILPALAEHFSLPASKVGFLTAAYPAGMFGALFVWPKLSDAIGRKTVLCLTLVGVGFGFVFQGMAVQLGWPFWAFIALRVLSGAFAGASPVVKAYIADISRTDEMPRYMAWREAAATGAFIVGPALGGLLFSRSAWSLADIIALSGWASVLGAFLCLFLIAPSKLEAYNNAPQVTPDGEPAINNAEVLVCPLGRSLVPIVVTICVTSFLYNVGQSTFDGFFSVYLKSTYQVSAERIGLLLTSLAGVSFGVSTLVFAPVVRRLGVALTCSLGLFLVALGLGMLGFMPTLPLVWVAAMVYVVGIPLFTPSVPILLMQCVPVERRGQIMGLDSAVNSVARILGPIIFGTVYGSSGAAVAFMGAAATVLLAMVITMVRQYLTLRENESLLS